MTRDYLRAIEPNQVRDKLNEAINKADEFHEIEGQLVDLLHAIDKRRLFIRFGYKSLSGFCVGGLQLTRLQAQRIVTLTRRRIDEIDTRTDEEKLREFKINIGSEKNKKTQIEFNIEPYNPLHF